MPLNKFLANLLIDERNLFMPCPFCGQGDYFMVASVDGSQIFYCAEFSLPFLSENYDKFIRDDKNPLDFERIDLRLNNFSFRSKGEKIEFHGSATYNDPSQDYRNKLCGGNHWCLVCAVA